jgi:hypothetical protein
VAVRQDEGALLFIGTADELHLQFALRALAVVYYR